jgi:hypothetical protein
MYLLNLSFFYFTSYLKWFEDWLKTICNFSYNIASIFNEVGKIELNFEKQFML